MKRILLGTLAGVGISTAVFAAAMYFGWLAIPHMSPAEDMEAMAEQPAMDEHAGHDMPDADMAAGDEDMNPAMAAAQSATADEHEGHDTGGATSEAMPGMEAEATVAEPAEGMPADAVMISPERQRLIGVRTARVERQNLDRTIRTVGSVEYDERTVAHIHTKVTGWIEALQVDFTGELVEKGQPLLEIYSPELLSTQEEYLLALRARQTLSDSSFPEVARSAANLLGATRRRLELWDLTAEQIDRIEEEGTPQKTITLYSPIQGYVIHKEAYEGKFVGPQDKLYTIADLQEVWVTGDIYEYEMPLVAVGQSARVTLPYFPGETFTGRIDYIYPYLTGATRTAKVRVVLENPDLKLKPDMYANLEIVARLGEGLLIPEDSIIDTGVRQVAFRVLPEGHFQPVEVRTGIKVGAYFQLLSGLEEGEEIVTGAAFLVDSESKLRSALRGMGGHVH
jgi:Cu(I)/Ag(I) efflux system membrane fusion protein